MKSSSYDSGFDSKELVSKVEKLELENSKLRQQEEQLRDELKDSSLKGTIAVSELMMKIF